MCDGAVVSSSLWNVLLYKYITVDYFALFFLMSCTSLDFCQQCMRIPVIPRLCQALELSVCSVNHSGLYTMDLCVFSEIYVISSKLQNF